MTWITTRAYYCGVGLPEPVDLSAAGSTFQVEAPLPQRAQRQSLCPQPSGAVLFLSLILSGEALAIVVAFSAVFVLLLALSLSLCVGRPLSVSAGAKKIFPRGARRG